MHYMFRSKHADTCVLKYANYGFLFFCLGELALHRLTWQRVWKMELEYLNRNRTAEIITWHPEGLYIAVIAGKFLTLVSYIMYPCNV